MESGTKLGHYEISSLIGKGGMGEVYQAKEEKLGRQVAIKVLPKEFAQDTDRVAQFRRSASCNSTYHTNSDIPAVRLATPAPRTPLVLLIGARGR